MGTDSPGRPAGRIYAGGGAYLACGSTRSARSTRPECVRSPARSRVGSRDAGKPRTQRKHGRNRTTMAAEPRTRCGTRSTVKPRVRNGTTNAMEPQTQWKHGRIRTTERSRTTSAAEPRTQWNHSWNHEVVVPRTQWNHKWNETTNTMEPRVNGTTNEVVPRGSGTPTRCNQKES